VNSSGRFPNFFVIGVAKAGTTSLYHYLGQHPEIFMSPVKEPRYFALAGHSLDFHGPGDERMREKTTTTLDAYLKLFAGVRDELAVGEASVIYIHHPAAAESIARNVPEAKIIAVLRDPIDRAQSAFLYHLRDGYEPLAEFDDALAAEPERIAAGWYYGWHYRDQGFYHRNLARYFERFDPSRIRVYLHEDLDGNPHGVLSDIFGFLGVDEGFRPDVSTRHNPSGRPRSHRAQRLLTRRHPLKEAVKSVIPEQWGHRLIAAVQPANLMRPPVKAETRARLVEGYADDIRQLESLIGRDLSHWLL
jgi:hypothetical protein